MTTQMHELIIDLFAGGGGASTGIELGTGKHVDIAINHDPEAISLHEKNHPQTRHYCSDVFEVDPMIATSGKPVGLLWASPDCKHFSKAKGGKPVSKKVRSLAWVVVQWAKAVFPRIIFLENVEEFQSWGPLDAQMKPDPAKKGETFRRWINSLKNLGYAVEWKELRGCDFGAPTIRKRLFLIARRDGKPVVWPRPTHSDPKQLQSNAQHMKPWISAADCIDWSLPCPSIFERKKPLAQATLKRIAKGIFRYVINSPAPFIVKRKAIKDIRHDHSALVSAFLAKHYTGVIGQGMNRPLGTITTWDHHSLVSANLLPLTDKENTHTNPHQGKIAALLVKYYGNERDGVDITEPMHTIPTKDRFGLVTVNISGKPFIITDIGMRMLQPQELYRAQGFPPDYIFDRKPDGTPLSKTAQVRMCGNSVCPPMAKALVFANYPTSITKKVV